MNIIKQKITRLNQENNSLEQKFVDMDLQIKEQGRIFWKDINKFLDNATSSNLEARNIGFILFRAKHELYAITLEQTNKEFAEMKQQLENNKALLSVLTSEVNSLDIVS